MGVLGEGPILGQVGGVFLVLALDVPGNQEREDLTIKRVSKTGR